MREYGLDAAALIAAVEYILHEQFGITENDLSETYTPAVHSSAKAEAL
jgi:transketolase